MGLDMYVYATDRQIDEDVDFPDGWPSDDELVGKDWTDIDSLNSDTKIFQWRKHPNLHGWMAQLYQKKGGSESPDEFGSTVKLTAEDIDTLEAHVQFKCLPHTTGFFFGESTDEDLVIDLEFIEVAREALAQGKTLYYTSSW